MSSFQAFLSGRAALAVLATCGSQRSVRAAPPAVGGADHHYIRQIASGVAVTKHAGELAAKNVVILVPMNKEQLSVEGFCIPHCFLVCKADGKYHLPPFAQGGRWTAQSSHATHHPIIISTGRHRQHLHGAATKVPRPTPPALADFPLPTTRPTTHKPIYVCAFAGRYARLPSCTADPTGGDPPIPSSTLHPPPASLPPSLPPSSLLPPPSSLLPGTTQPTLRLTCVCAFAG